MIYPDLYITETLDNDTFTHWLQFQIRMNSFKKCKERVDHIQAIGESIVKPGDEIIECPNVNMCLEWLNTVPQPEQRTPEWYSYRHSVVTASSASDIFDTSRYQIYLKEKVMPERHFVAGSAAQHGIKFELMAQYIYEDKTKTKITEYGCVKHKTISHLGASPDGIVTSAENPIMLGRMLEIKNVYSRTLTGIPLYGYWVQCQIQMEVCDLEYCDFFECDMDISRGHDKFFTDLSNDKLSKYYGIIFEYRETLDGKIEYKYSDLFQSKDGLLNWYNEMSEELLKDDNTNIEKITYWDIKEMSLVTIRRHREWFESAKVDIAKFGNEVEEKRQILRDTPDMKDKLFVKSNHQKRKRIQNSDICMILDD
jgi:putative phage-type endonuclease